MKLPHRDDMVEISIDPSDPMRAPTETDVRRILGVAGPAQFDPSWAYAPWCSGTVKLTTPAGPETLRFQLFHGGRGALVDEAGTRLEFAFEIERTP
jgi:hypothetical protein